MNRILRIFCAVLALIITVGAIQTAEAQQFRKIVIEEGTNASCGPCASQNPSFKLWIDRNKGRVIPIIYHASWPGTDPMYTYNTSLSTDRISAYYGMTGVPSARVNGLVATPVGNYYEGAPGDTAALTKLSNTFLKFSPVNLKVTMTNENGTGKVDVEASSLLPISMSNLKLRVIVCELYHYYATAGTNGEHDFYYIARKMLPTNAGTTVAFANANEKQTFSFDYSVNADMATGLYAVAILQNDNTKEILQAESTLDWPVDAPKFGVMANSFNAPFEVLGEGESIETGYTFINNSDEQAVATITTDRSAKSTWEWNVTSSETGEFTIEPNTTKIVNITITPNSTIGIAEIIPKFNIQATENVEIIAPTATVLHSGVKSLQILDGPNDNSLTSIIGKLKPAGEYIEILSDQFLANANKISNLKYLVWNTSSNGAISSSDITAIMNLMSNNVGMLLCGGSINSGMVSNGGLGVFGISFLNYSREGYGSAPYRIWLSGVADDPITGDFGENKEGNLILYLTPTYKIENTTTTKPILTHAKSQDTIVAVRVTKTNSRHVFMGINPYIIVDQDTRNRLIKNALQWIETGATDVEETTQQSLSLKASPNPVSTVSTVEYYVSGDNSQAVKLALYDNLGREIIILKNEQMQPGAYTAELNVSSLVSGSYRLVMTTVHGTATLPVAVAK